MNWVKHYLLGIFAAISQLFNAALGGHPNMTISARAHCSQQDSVWAVARKVVNAVFFWQVDHCRQSWEQDERFCEALCCGKDASD